GRCGFESRRRYARPRRGQLPDNHPSRAGVCWPSMLATSALRAPGPPYHSKKTPTGGRVMRITTKGQVTIPIEIREKLGLLPATEVEFQVVGNAVRITKAQGRQSRGRALVERL